MLYAFSKYNHYFFSVMIQRFTKKTIITILKHSTVPIIRIFNYFLVTGFVEMEMSLLSKDEAEKHPVGKKRNKPNHVRRLHIGKTDRIFRTRRKNACTQRKKFLHSSFFSFQIYACKAK